MMSSAIIEVFQAVARVAPGTGGAATGSRTGWIMACGGRHLHPDDLLRLAAFLGPASGILLMGTAWAWRREVVARRRAQAAEMENLRLSDALESIRRGGPGSPPPKADG